MGGTRGGKTEDASIAVTVEPEVEPKVEPESKPVASSFRSIMSGYADADA
jgi:hypothetical protein